MTALDLTSGRFGQRELDAALDLLSERDLQAIEAKLGLETPAEPLRKTLAHILYKTIRDRSTGSVDPAAVKNLLKRVGISASTLKAQIVPMLFEDTPSSIREEAAFLLHNSSATIDLIALTNSLDALIAGADAATRLVPKRTGRRPDERHMLLKQLNGVLSLFECTTIQKAYEELKAMADALRKADPNISEAKAFAKVYEDPANADLVKRERAESKLNGDVKRKYTKIADSDTYDGDLFHMFKAVEKARARFYREKPPKDSTLAKFIERSLPPTKPRRKAKHSVGSTGT